jgi:elongation factor Ts
VLLDQPYLMDQSKTVGEAIKEAIAAIGENIQVRRFTRYVLGEGIEKKASNLAEEVAAATGAKA